MPHLGTLDLRDATHDPTALVDKIIDTLQGDSPVLIDLSHYQGSRIEARSEAHQGISES